MRCVCTQLASALAAEGHGANATEYSQLLHQKLKAGCHRRFQGAPKAADRPRAAGSHKPRDQLDEPAVVHHHALVRLDSFASTNALIREVQLVHRRFVLCQRIGGGSGRWFVAGGCSQFTDSKPRCAMIGRMVVSPAHKTQTQPRTQTDTHTGARTEVQAEYTAYSARHSECMYIYSPAMPTYDIVKSTWCRSPQGRRDETEPPVAVNSAECLSRGAAPPNPGSARRDRMLARRLRVKTSARVRVLVQLLP